MHQWIEISGPQDFDKLKDVLESKFSPETVASRLKEKVNPRCRGLLVEYPYVDKDYRSTYYNFYAKKGRKYDSFCARLHFFDDGVKLSTGLELQDREGKLGEKYFGYMVLRPTYISTIGRSLLSPSLINGFHGLLIESTQTVHILGHRLSVKGFPYMSQHTDVSVCAHVACWAILRHYSERFPRYAEFLTHDVTRMAYSFDPGGLLPSKGLQVSHAERVFAAAGAYPIVVVKNSADQSLFYRQLFAYVESAFPLFCAMHSKTHAIAAVGHGVMRDVPKANNAPIHFSSDMIDELVVVDDNVLPYLCVARGQAGPYSIDDIDAFIVPLPEKLFYSAEAVDGTAQLLAGNAPFGFDHSALGPLVLRYFVTTSAAYRRFINDSRSQFAPQLIVACLELTMPQFVWIIEIATLAQWKARQITTRAVLDATASQFD